MDTIKLAGLLDNATEDLQLAKDLAAADIRSLGDWELALVAGGDGIPTWP
ncbi:MAG: hypothetical protein IPH30_06840 [Betaproteobacteria bacterium]|nr:hypothetical protein [Betaproteobacteria bacterium]